MKKNLNILRPVDTLKDPDLDRVIKGFKTKKLEEIKNYNLHKSNRLLSYFSKESINPITRVENTLNKNILIEDLAEKKINLANLKGKKNIGRRSIELLEYYSKLENLEKLISSRSDLGQDILVEVNSMEIEKMILEDIENLRNNYNERYKIVFDCQFGYKRNIL